MATIQSIITSGPPSTPGPLESLYKNKYDVRNYGYPRDVGSSYKGHSILFKFSEVNNTFQGVSSVSQAYDVVAKQAEDFTQVVKSSFNNGTSIDLNPQVTEIPGDSVRLYMPDTLEFNYNADYSNLSIAEAGQEILSQLSSSLNKVNGLGSTTKLAINNFGYAFNPQQQLLFNGIDFRTYSMSFTFTPHSPAEAQNVKNIIKTFKKYSMPEITTGTAGFFFKLPGRVNLSFLTEGVGTNTFIPLLKTSVIESVQVNYAPNGWSAVGMAGSPAQTTMTVGFREVQLVTKSDIETGY